MTRSHDEHQPAAEQAGHRREHGHAETERYQFHGSELRRLEYASCTVLRRSVNARARRRPGHLEDSCATQHRRTRPSSKRSKRASGSSRSTTCCSPAAPPASAACCASSSDHARRNGVKQPFTANTPYINTIPADRTAAVSGQPRDRAPHQEPRSLERAGDGRQGQQGRRRHRRSHLDLRVGRHALRSRLQPLLQGQGRGPRRRHHLLPGTCGARHLRARVPRRTLCRRRSSRTSAAS